MAPLQKDNVHDNSSAAQYIPTNDDVTPDAYSVDYAQQM